jgi:hypothetical protein
MESLITTLEKRDTFNTQVIEELDKMLNLAKYGSVGHVTKIVRLSSMRNYKLRLTEIVQAYKEVTDIQSIQNIETYIASVLADSRTNLKNSNDSLNTTEIFSNDYIKNEILAKTYKELVDLYTEAEAMLKKVKESFVGVQEPIVDEPTVKKERSETKNVVTDKEPV